MKRYVQKQNRRKSGLSATHTSYALFYHLVWGTKNALPLIKEEIEAPLKQYIIKLCKSLKIEIIEMEFVDNHVHLLISLKPIHFIPEIIKKLKGSSSHFINHVLNNDDYFKWGRGYSIRTVSEKNMKTAIEYIRSQKLKHV